MKTDKISDILQGMDVNTERAIATLSDKVWEDSPDNEGWGVVSRYLEKHLQDCFWK